MINFEYLYSKYIFTFTIYLLMMSKLLVVFSNKKAKMYFEHNIRQKFIK